jgi:hypothetical protein
MVEGGTCIPGYGYEMPVWIYEGSLQRIDEECKPYIHELCPGEFVSRQGQISGDVGVDAPTNYQ